MTPRLDARLAGDLWFFRVTVEAGGFSRASERLAVTQSAVTQRIQRLEERLGYALMVRTGRVLQLTEPGQELYEATRGFDVLVEALRRLGRREDRRTLRVSCIPSLASEWLVPRLKTFSDGNQGLDVAVFADVVDLDRTRMEQEGIDIAIRYGPAPSPGAPVVYDYVEPVYPVCSPAYRLTLDQAGTNHAVTLLHDASPWPSASRPTEEWSYWLEARGAPGSRPVRNTFFNLAQLALRASISGSGVALGRSLLVSSHIADGHLIRFCESEPLQKFRYFIHSRERVLSDDETCFVEWIVNQLSLTLRMQINSLI